MKYDKISVVPSMDNYGTYIVPEIADKHKGLEDTDTMMIEDRDIANLFQAAPDLLGACQSLIDMLEEAHIIDEDHENDCSYCAAIEQGYAAIKKAEGK